MGLLYQDQFSLDLNLQSSFLRIKPILLTDFVNIYIASIYTDLQTISNFIRF